jgi:uncharacterized protein YdeI (BOF family)
MKKLLIAAAALLISNSAMADSQKNCAGLNDDHLPGWYQNEMRSAGVSNGGLKPHGQATTPNERRARGRAPSFFDKRACEKQAKKLKSS